MSWLAVYARAVVGPAYRQAAAVWAGCGLVAAVTFGGNGIYPRDVAKMVANDPSGIGAVVVGIWLLVFLPIARALVRAEPARFLQSLPHGRVGPIAVVTGALIGLQLPWVVLWLTGARWGGLVVVGTTVALVGLSIIRAPGLRAAWPGWRSGIGAMVSIYRRALTRRAGDALLRGAGLAALAGVIGALFVRNNQSDAILGAAVATIMLVPARVGTLAVLGDTTRRSTWLAESMGVTPLARSIALATGLFMVHAITGAIAVAVAALIVRDATIVAGWAGLQLAIAACAAIFEVRVVMRAKETPAVVIGSLAGAVLVAASLGVFGVLGLAVIATGAIVYVSGAR